MRIIISGSTQTKHIRELFRSMDVECIELSSDSNAVKRRITNLFKLIRADAVYNVGGFDVETNSFYRLANKLHKKIIIHWIGTDVLNITRSYNEFPRQINMSCINLAGSTLLQQELRRISISAKIIPIVPLDIHFTALPMPQEHAVIAYVPKNREAFYGMDIIKRVAIAFPNVPFHIVANDGENDHDRPENIVYEGNLNSEQMHELYEKCSVLFRYPEHDGLSMMVLEAMGTGRTVIYKYPFPYTITPCDGSMEEIINSFRNVFSVPPQINHEAINYTQTEFSADRQLERYREAGVL